MTVADNSSKNKSLDDFWNIEQLVPRKKGSAPSYIDPPVPVEITAEPVAPITDGAPAFTVKRFIPPYESGNINDIYHKRG